MRHGASCSSRRTDAPPRVRAGLWTRRDLCNVGVLIRESLPGGGAWREWAGLPPEQQPRAPDADAPRRIVFLTRADAPATGLPTPTCAAFRRSGSNCRVKSDDRGAHSAASPICSRNQDRVAFCSSLRTSRRWRRVGVGALPPPPRHRPRARFAVQMPLLQTSLRHGKSPRTLGGASVRREEQDAPWRIRVRSAVHLRLDEKHRPSRCADEARLRPDSAGSVAAAGLARLGDRSGSPGSTTRGATRLSACSARARCPSPAVWW